MPFDFRDKPLVPLARFTKRRFLSQTILPGEHTEAELEERRIDRRKRGLCPECGRPFAAAALDGEAMRLSCPRGHLEYAKRGSKLYRLAATGMIGGKP